jgi:hypothetical protein
VKISAPNSWFDGRVSYYRPSSAPDEYEFAMTLSLENALTGTSYTGFNTFSPGPNSTASSPNWLGITNLDNYSKKVFYVTTYDHTGALSTQRELTIPPLGRVDIEGGHSSVGSNSIGLQRIVPADLTSPYLASLIRYGSKNDSEFTFAIPFPAKSPGSGTQYLPVSHIPGEASWVEISNASPKTARVTISFYDNSGAFLSTRELTLSPYGQSHIGAHEELTENTTGHVRLSSSEQGSLIAFGVSYFVDSNGEISTAYGRHSRLALGSTLRGSYNLFLGMHNWLKVVNLSDSLAQATLRVFRSSGAFYTETLSIPAYGAKDIGLHEGDRFGTTQNSYGSITITPISPTSPGSIMAEVLRVKPATSDQMDFSVPTIMR